MLKIVNNSKYIGLAFIGGLGTGFGIGMIIGVLLCLLVTGTAKMINVYC